MKCIDEIINRLGAEIMLDPSGVNSLDHVAVVVPTAQSARRLRFALSRKYGAILPPVMLTSQILLSPAQELECNSATKSEALCALFASLGENATLQQANLLLQVRHILSANMLSFADVYAKTTEEKERWQSLAALEEKYYSFLKKHDLADSIEILKESVDRLSIATRLSEKGVSKIIVTCEKCLLPVAKTVLRKLECSGFETEWFKFAELDKSEKDRKVVFKKFTTDDEEAREIANMFSRVAKNEQLPQLCVAKPSMYSKLQCTFEANGIKLHNPSSVKLSTSSLGHLVLQIVDLKHSSSYNVFSSFIRGGDVRRWICSELKISNEEMTESLIALDRRQADLLPEKIEDIAPRTIGKLRAIFEFVSTCLRKKDLRAILQSIFREHYLDESVEASREFAAAAEKVNEIISEVENVKRFCVSEKFFCELLLMRLGEETYSLECDQGEAVMSDGFLELPYLDADELVISGFQESCVPEMVVSHPFLPNLLRKQLGLPDNDSRRDRDREIFERAVLERDYGAVKVFFHLLDGAGDVVKPSQFVFETDDDKTLLYRAENFYKLSEASAQGGSKKEDFSSDMHLPNCWRLKLPIPPAYKKLETTSPTRLDGYLRCPFTYYLIDKSVIGDKRMDDRAQELASYEYGNLAHEALELWGKSEYKDSLDPEVISRFLSEKVDAILAERFGVSIPAIVSLQGESVKRRLANFANIQTAWRKSGWRIVETEYKLKVRYGHTRFEGKCDRIDYNESTGKWCVIDYKTWDNKSRAKIYSKEKKFLSLQLPIYCAMLDACDDERFKDAKLENTVSCYCVLGDNKQEVSFSEVSNSADVPEAERLARHLIERIEKGIFWPPGPPDNNHFAWEYNYADWLSPSPMETVDGDWIKDQESRLSDSQTEFSSSEGISVYNSDFI
jgi:ATP-dependent helicase/nuclease subunit B